MDCGKRILLKITRNIVDWLFFVYKKLYKNESLDIL